MTQQKIDGEMFAQMVLQGAHHLSNNAEKIDALNVFPVPDGDTGTNMNLSITSGANEVKNADQGSVSLVANAFAKGLLMGARGNSGVILSQLFRGFSKGIEGKSVLAITDLATALESGVTTAYKAVMKPVEGTILTVAKDTAEAAKDYAKTEENINTFMEKVLQASKDSLKRTPDLLPVLKEVGVVDSGGQGLVVIFEGFVAAMKGEALPEQSSQTMDLDDMVNAEHHKLAQDYMNTEDIEYGYCTEFMVRFEEDKLADNPYDEEKFREELSEHGDSLLVVSDDDVVKVHIHAEYPGDIFNLGQRFGSFIHLKVENMREQHSAIVGQKQDDKHKEKSHFAVVTVAMGEGITELFKSLGVTTVIEGGQTMNPSTQDLADAVKEANAENVILLPNNKNIVMAAEQAAELAEGEVAVVKTTSIPQGMAAMLAYNPEGTLEENEEAMAEAMKEIKTGQVTYAVRDTQIDGMTIENGHFMGIAEGKIKVTNPDHLTVVKELLTEMIDTEEDEIVTILSGQEATEEEEAEIIKFIEDHFEDMEVETHKGDQPIYSYIFSIE